MQTGVVNVTTYKTPTDNHDSSNIYFIQRIELFGLYYGMYCLIFTQLCHWCTQLPFVRSLLK